MIRVVRLLAKALKELKKSPKHIQEKFSFWVVSVEKTGIEETRKRPGWHDEPLQGERKGQRSIRLNKQWRAIYVIKRDNTIELVEVMEVTPHEY